MGKGQGNKKDIGNREAAEGIRYKAVVDSKGEPQAARIEIPVEGGGGALGV